MRLLINYYTSSVIELQHSLADCPASKAAFKNPSLNFPLCFRKDGYFFDSLATDILKSSNVILFLGILSQL